MKLLNNLTLTSLKMNKKRTIVTIIGILLATALIMAVSTMVVSFQWSMIEHEKNDKGNFHYEFEGVPAEELAAIEQNRSIANYYLVQGIGYAELSGSVNEGKPYLYLQGMDASAYEDSAFELLEGRLPENENEVVISRHIATNGGVKYEVGDTLTLEIGRRISEDGKELDQWYAYHGMGEESLEPMYTKAYTIVGVAERPSNYVEPRTAPGYTIMTYLNEEEITGKVNIYTLFTTEGMKNRYKVLSTILGVDEELAAAINGGAEYSEEQSDMYYENVKYNVNSNAQLISFQNLLSFEDGTLLVVYTMAGIVMAIIIFTSAFCIRNSFGISITEKTKQYGMLSSVGATPKQIKLNVYYEALILGAVGIPLGVLSGLFACWVLLRVVGAMVGDYFGAQLVFHCSIGAMIGACLLSAVMIWLSAGTPARRAAKVSPIEAIRGAGNIQIKAKQVKSPGWVKKIFGLGGTIAYKNMKRNKKQYRVAVVSIAVSVAVFVSLYSFMNMVFSASEYYMGKQSFSLAISTSSSQISYYDQFNRIGELELVDRASVVRHANLYYTGTKPAYSEAMKTYFKEERGLAESDFLDVQQAIEVIAVGDAEYEHYLRELNLSPEDYKDQGVLINNFYTYLWNGENDGQYTVISIYDEKEGDVMEGSNVDPAIEADEITGEAKDVSIQLAAVTDLRPLGMENYYMTNGLLLVSDALFDTYFADQCYYTKAYYEAEDADALQEVIQTEYGLEELNYENIQKEYQRERSMYVVIAIFLYGFITVISLIGITNIFNTITTCMDLRSKEFAMLKSVGMTTREFNHMVRMESVFYGTKSLLVGIPIGVILAFVMNQVMSGEIDMVFAFPWGGIVIAVVVVFLLLFGIMRFSLGKINRQNIIETIRQDNI